MDGRCSCACNHRRLVSRAEKPCNHPATLVSRVYQANQHQLLWLLGRLGLVKLTATPSGGQAPSLPSRSPLSQVPSHKIPKSQVVTCSLQPDQSKSCPPAAAVAGRTTKDGTTTADRACQPVTSISHRSSALGSPTPPLAAAGCCADLPRLPLPGPGWPSRRGGSLGVCASGPVCLVAPGCALHGHRLRAGWLVAFTAGVPPGRGAVDPSVMHWP